MTREAPPILYNSDGLAMAVRGDLASTARKALRLLVKAEGMEDAVQDFIGCVDINDDGSVYRPRLSDYRDLVASTTTSWWRLADPNVPEECEGDFGEDTWLPCGADHPAAVVYWKGPFDV